MKGMRDSSISVLIYTKRKVLFVLLLFAVLVIFFSTALREIKISQEQAGSLSSFIIESIRKLSSAGELLYAQRELDAIAEKMKFVGKLDILVSVQQTNSVLAKIETDKYLAIFVEKNEQLQAIPFGLINITVKVDVVGKIISAMLYAFLLSLLLVFGFLISLLYLERTENRFLVPLGDILSWISNLDASKNEVQKLSRESLEPNLLLIYEKINEIIEQNTRLQLNDHLIFQSKQVAHDIRSPLSVLNMLTPSLFSESTEKKDLILQAVARINGIAENLLTKGVTANSGKCSDLYELVLRIVEEKKLQFQDSIVFTVTNRDCSVPIVVDVNEIELSRVISNLINNSAEAFDVTRGEIVIQLQNSDKETVIVITDNGRGISNEVLNRIGERGFTFGKNNLSQSGSGLGIYGAKKLMSEVNGSFEIFSSEGMGTTVQLKFFKKLST